MLAGSPGCSLIDDLLGEDETAAAESEIRSCSSNDDCARGSEFCYRGPGNSEGAGWGVCQIYECLDDRECESRGKICDVERHVCIEDICRQDQACNAGDYCDQVVGKCRTGCRDDSCLEDEFCDHRLSPRVCVSRGCRADTECAYDEYCRLDAVVPPQFDPPVEEGGDPPPVVEGQCLFGCRAGEADSCEFGKFCDSVQRRCEFFGCETQDDCEFLSDQPVPEDCAPDREVCLQPVYCDPDISQCRFGCLPLRDQADTVSCLDPEAQYCAMRDPRRQCVLRRCVLDEDCARSDYYCAPPRPGDIYGRCEQGCRTGGCPFPDREICDPESRRCLPFGCDVDEDCEECVDRGECSGDAPHYCQQLTRQCRSGCRYDADCDGGRSCDDTLRRCIGDPCLDGDQDCFPEEFCGTGPPGAGNVCLLGCRVTDSSSCPPFFPCRHQDRRCGCRVGENDCERQLVCVDSACVIQCNNDGTCREHDLICDENVGHCVEGCVDDIYEIEGENEMVDVGAMGGLDNEELVLCRRDNDWFSVPVEIGQSLTVSLEFEHRTGNLDLYLYGPEDDRDASLDEHCRPRPDGLARCRRGRGNLEQVSFASPPQPGIWYVSVRRTDNHAKLARSPRVPYSLNVRVGVAPAACGEDELEGGEPGANDVRARAVPVDSGAWPILKMCDAAHDWYQFFLAQEDVLHARLVFDSVATNLDMELFGPLFPEETVAEARCTALTCEDPGVERIDVGPVPGGWEGTYLLHVFAERTTRMEYAMQIDIERSADACVASDEALEPNEDPLSATPVEAGLNQLAICPDGDQDHVVLNLPEKSSLRAALRYTQRSGFPSLDFEIFNPDGRLVVDAPGRPLIRSSFVDDTTRNIILEAGGIGTGFDHVLRVYQGSAYSIGEYELDLQIVEPAPCEDDAREDNDAPGTASLLMGGHYPGLRLCPWDDDWYRFHAGALDDVEVLVEADGVGALVNLQLFDDEATPLEDCIDGEQVIPDCAVRDIRGAARLASVDVPDGTYLLRVWTSNEGLQSVDAGYVVELNVARDP